MTPRNALAQRHACGRIIQPLPEETEAEAVAVALAQPHRRGSRDQLRVDSVGRLILKHSLKREIAAAVDRYKIVRHDWLRAFEYPCGERLEMFDQGKKASGLGPSWRTVKRWRRKLDHWEMAARREDALGWAVLRQMIFDGREIGQNLETHVVCALVALAVATGKLAEKNHPFL